MQEFFINDGAIRLHSKLDRPEGKDRCPLVILIHGLTGNMEERHILAAAETMKECGFAVLRVEMYGHGQSDGAFEDHDLFKWLNNTMTVTDWALAQDWVTDLYLCGHSQGGLDVILAAGMRPDAYKAVIPLAPGIVITDMARKGSHRGMVFEPGHVPEYVYFGSHRIKGNYVRAAGLLDTEYAIAQYKGPVLLVHGDADKTVDMKYSVWAAERYQNATLKIIHGDSHCFDYHLEEMCEAIREFLKQFESD